MVDSSLWAAAQTYGITAAGSSSAASRWISPLFVSGSVRGVAIVLTVFMQIFASLNYRVNVFGFMYSSEVQAEGGGNYGLLDQVSAPCAFANDCLSASEQLAIRWIHENIAAFGGDPTKITLMGER